MGKAWAGSGEGQDSPPHPSGTVEGPGSAFLMAWPTDTQRCRGRHCAPRGRPLNLQIGQPIQIQIPGTVPRMGHIVVPPVHTGGPFMVSGQGCPECQTK